MLLHPQNPQSPAYLDNDISSGRICALVLALDRKTLFCLLFWYFVSEYLAMVPGPKCTAHTYQWCWYIQFLLVLQAEYNVGELFWYLLWIYIRMFIIMKWLTYIYYFFAFYLSILFSEGNYLYLICKLVKHLWDFYWLWDLTLTDIGMHLLISVCYVPMFVPGLPIAANSHRRLPTKQ